MTRWWWVRHGPTHEKTFVGWRDVPADLSDLAQIERLAGYLPPSALLVASDLSRAAQTARALGRGDPLLDPDLREFNFGDWDGLPFDEVSARDPDLSRAFWEHPGDIAPPNGESWNAVAARVNASVERISAAHPGRDIVAVAHIGVILTQVQRGIGGTAYAALGHRIDNLSVTDLSHDGQDWQIGTINHIP